MYLYFFYLFIYNYECHVVLRTCDVRPVAKCVPEPRELARSSGSHPRVYRIKSPYVSESNQPRILSERIKCRYN